MKLVKQVLAVAILFLGVFSYAQEAKVNVEQSSVSWVGKKITGQHDGNISIQSGALELKNNQLINGNFVIDMNSMTCNDLESPEYNQKLIGHLKSDDFFGVAKFPTASFTITEATPFVDQKATVKGTLTIKGISNPVEFVVMQEGNMYTANLEVDRSKFDVRYGSTSFFDNLKDKAIDDIFLLDIKLIVE